MDLRMKSFELTSNSRLVMQMCPFNSIRVEKLPRRKMEVSFQNGCRCFYKLLMDFGCGSAWSKWRNIEATSTKQNYRSRWALIRFAELDRDVQNYLRNERFLRPTKLLNELLSIRKSDHDAIGDDKPMHSKPSYDRSNFHKKRGHLLKAESFGKELGSKSGLPCHSFEAEVNLPKTDFAEISSDYVKRKLGFSETIIEIEKARDDEKPARGLERSKGTRKTRKVQRFGEGIPEGCTFDLSLSYSDSVSDEEGVDSKRVLKKESARLSAFDYLSEGKVALKDIRCSRRLIPIKDNLSEGKVALKDIRFSRHMIPIKDTDRSRKSIRQISEMAGHCPSISPLTLIPREPRRSQSVDSIIPIESMPYHLEYLKSNLSLPNLDEILFHRRTHRLSYDSEFDRSLPDEGNNLSFQMPEVENEDSCGRVYDPTPVSRKLEALKLKSAFLRPNARFPSSQEDGSNSSIRSPLSSEHTCGKEEEMSAFTKKLLDEMDNEYPIRHSLWVESPDTKNPTSSPQNTDISTDAEKASDTSSPENGKHIAEVSEEIVARGLKAIQQELFCKIESSELARYILKPHTVTEVNSPYLCGYLYFYERMRNLIISELLSKRSTSETAEIFRYFVQVACLCLQLRDKQSTCAILSGLCNLGVLGHRALWSALHESMPNEMSTLSQILQIDWNERKHRTFKSEIPFFRSILEVLVEELPREFAPYPYKRRRFSEFVKEWYQWKRERKMPETSLVDHLTNALSGFFTKCRGKRKNSQNELDYSADDLFTTGYRELEEILDVIEECRKYYSFTIDSLPVDNDARYFLLHKKILKRLSKSK